MRHFPSSPAGTPAGGKKVILPAREIGKNVHAHSFRFPRAGKTAIQPITDRLQGQPRLKLTVLKHVSTKTRI